MRLPTRSFLSGLALLGAVALVVTGSLAGSTAYFGGAVALLLGAALVVLMRADRRVPAEDETRAYVAGVLCSRGYAGAFRLGDFTQVASPGIEPGHVLVKFRGDLAFHEPLYQPATPDPEVFKGLTPRKIEWLRKAAAMLEAGLGPAAAGMAGRVPADPFRAVFVSERKPGGWTLPYSGSAWAVWRGGAWTWETRNLSQSIDTLVVHGRPLAAYPAAVALGTREGSSWLKTTLAAWRDFETEVASLQKKLDEKRAALEREAMDGFFRAVQPGAVYHGPGESLTQQAAAAVYGIEFVAASAMHNTVSFTLRNERRWQAARAFSGSVTFDAAAQAVAISARTTAADAQPEGGPLLSVAAAFDLELQWTPGPPARLEGAAVDLALRLRQVSPEELERTLERVRAHERAVAAATAPGRAYRGTVALAPGERVIRIEFLPTTEATEAVARVAIGDWSGTFRVVPPATVQGDEFDIALESTTPAEAEWGPVLLRLASGRLSGFVVSGETRSPVGPLVESGPTPP